MKHLCHAEGCRTAVPPRMLMCLKHWRMVPRELQRMVWQHYRPGQEETKDPSIQYLVVQRLACAAVAEREGKQAAAARCKDEASALIRAGDAIGQAVVVSRIAAAAGLAGPASRPRRKRSAVH